nr:hypothetical protein [Lachnospiraceae bacterium]
VDYDDKNISYYYLNDTYLDNGNYDQCFVFAGEEVRETDIIPEGTYIRAEIKGKGNYAAIEGYENSDVLEVDFKYYDKAKDISKAGVKLNNSNLEYSGENGLALSSLLKDDNLVLSLNKGTEKLSLGRDYEVESLINNINAGKATVTVRGIGEYGGKKSFSFKIQGKTLK